MTEKDSFDLLLQAAKSGNTKELTKLLNEGVDYKKNWFQALTEASREDNDECVRLLLKKAIEDHPFPQDAMSLSGCNCVPLTVAIDNYNWEVVEILMELYCKATTKELGYAFASACKLQDTKCLEVIVERLSGEDRKILDVAEHDGMRPLHMAIKSRNLRAMEVLLKAGADPDVEPKQNGYEFSGWGTRSYDVSRAFAAVGNISDPNDGKNEMRYEDLPLHYAARRGDMMAAAMLLCFGANPGIWNGVQEVPVVTAIRCSQMDCVKVLSGVTPPRFVSQAIVEAAMDRNLECLEFLFKKGYPTFASNSGECDALTDWRTILFPENWSNEIKPGNPDDKLAKTVSLLFENGTAFYGIATSDDFFLPMFFQENILKTFKVFCDSGLVEMHCDLSGDFMAFSMAFQEIMCNYIDMQRALDYDDPYAYFLEDPDLTGLNPLPSISIFMDHFPFAKLDSDSTPLKNLHKGLAPVVPPLKKLCRWTIRCTIIEGHHLILKEHVSKLGLPKSLRNFILYQ